MPGKFWLPAIASALVSSGALCAQTPSPIEEEDRPLRLSGMGLNVTDIEAARDFHTQVLGLKVALRIPGADGEDAAHLRAYLIAMHK